MKCKQSFFLIVILLGFVLFTGIGCDNALNSLSPKATAAPNATTAPNATARPTARPTATPVATVRPNTTAIPTATVRPNTTTAPTNPNADISQASLALSYGLSAAARSTNPASSAYHTSTTAGSPMTIVYNLSNYVSSNSLTLNGKITVVMNSTASVTSMLYNGTITFTTGTVASIKYDKYSIVGTTISGYLIYTFRDGSIWRFNAATSSYTQY